jgi:hypothetical protein
MQVIVKSFDINMEIKNKGVELDVYSADGSKRLGDVKITKTGLTWCNGKAQTGPKATWEEFIEWMNS